MDVFTILFCLLKEVVNSRVLALRLVDVMREIFVNPLVIACDICTVAVLTALLITLKLCLIVRDIFCIAVLIDLDTSLILFVILVTRLFMVEEDPLFISYIIFCTTVARSVSPSVSEFLIWWSFISIFFSSSLKSLLSPVTLPPMCD